MVFVSHDETIDGSVTFTQDTNVTENLEVHNTVQTSYLSGINIQSWKNDVANWNDDLSQSI